MTSEIIKEFKTFRKTCNETSEQVLAWTKSTEAQRVLKAMQATVQETNDKKLKKKTMAHQAWGCSDKGTCRPRENATTEAWVKSHGNV